MPSRKKTRWMMAVLVVV